MTTTRVALYTRVSTDMQAGKDEGSLDTQEARLKAFLQSRPGEHVVAATFREEGASGKNLDRPALRRLMDSIKRGEVDLVVVTRLDRLSRSLLDFYELHSLFEKHEVRFVSLNETFDTSSPVGRAMLKLVLVFAELEREQTAERTRQAMRARAERGLWNGGAPPLGYDSSGSGHLTVNEDEAALVRLAFDKYLDLRSSPKLAKWLNEQGHRQKRFTSRRKGETGGKKFSPASVRLMLKNRLYLGEVSHKDDYFEGKHDGIIDPDVFERVQGVIEGNAVNRRAPQETARHDFPLTGVAQCSCGYALTSSAGTGRGGKSYFYYRCVGLQKNVDHPCEVRQIRAELLEEAVFALVREAGNDPVLLATAVEEANQMARDKVAPLRERVSVLKRDLAQVEEEAKQTFKQILASGVAGSAMAKSTLAEIESRQEALQQSLAEAEGELAGKESQQLDLELIAQALQGFDKAFDHLTSAEKRDFLQLLIHRAVVSKDKVDVELYDGRSASRFLAVVTRNGVYVGPGPGNENGDELVKEFAAGSKWLPIPDSNHLTPPQPAPPCTAPSASARPASTRSA